MRFMVIFVFVAASLVPGLAASDVAPPAPPAPPLPPQPSRLSAEQMKKFASNVTRGRSLSARRRWADAIRAFEAALSVLPMNQQALTDLGWAAFQAGDLPKARKATQAALLAATFPEVRGAVLYNLGRISEADGDKSAAARHYQQSLDLRPNATVEGRLKTLRDGATVARWSPVVTQPLSCPEPIASAKLCRCLVKDDEPSDGPCNLTKDKRLPGNYRLVLAATKNDVQVTQYLAVVEGGMARAVAELATAYNPGAFGIHEELSIKKIRKGRAGGRDYLWIETQTDRGDSDMGLDEMSSSTEVDVTVVFIDGKPPVLRFPIGRHYLREALGIMERGEDEPPIEHAQKLPIRSDMDLDADLSETGVLTLKLRKGKVSGPKGLLGEHHVLP